MTGIAAIAGTFFRTADRWLRPVEVFFAAIAAVMMFAAMVLNALDAILRYAINHPLNFNLFVTENYLMVGMICMPMAWAFRTGGYIRISALLNTLPKGVGDLLLRAGLVISAYYCARLTWTAFLNWHDSYVTDARQLGVVDWPWHWSWVWVPLGLGLLTLRLILTAIGPAAELVVQPPLDESAA